MTHSLLGQSRRNRAFIVVAAASIAASACSTSSGSRSGSGFSTSPLSQSVARKPATYLWTYAPINVTGAINTEVRGIDNATVPEIVGVYYGNSSEGVKYNSFTATQASGTYTFTYASYPRVGTTPTTSATIGTQMSGIAT